MIKEKKYSTKSPYFIHVLDISTGHISPNDGVLLDNSKKDINSPIIVYDYPEGYFVYVPQIAVEEELEGFMTYGMSEEFCKIIKLASDKGCKYVQFDCDGIEYEDLKIIEM
jgi:hypothetical protein